MIDCSVALTKLTEYEINKKWTKNKSEPTEKKKKGKQIVAQKYIFENYSFYIIFISKYITNY